MLSVTSGGGVSDSYGYLGFNGGSTGTATVDGPGSKWMNGNYFFVGLFGNGTLNITGGGSVSNTNGYVGYNGNVTGTVLMSGAGTTWTNSADLYVGSTARAASPKAAAPTPSREPCTSAILPGAGTYSLNGGTLIILTVLVKGAGTANFNFGGGTLQAGGPFSANLPMNFNGQRRQRESRYRRLCGYVFGAAIRHGRAHENRCWRVGSFRQDVLRRKHYHPRRNAEH